MDLDIVPAVQFFEQANGVNRTTCTRYANNQSQRITPCKIKGVLKAEQNLKKTVAQCKTVGIYFGSIEGTQRVCGQSSHPQPIQHPEAGS
jgi:hypothetical protein